MKTTVRFSVPPLDAVPLGGSSLLPQAATSRTLAHAPPATRARRMAPWEIRFIGYSFVLALRAARRRVGRAGGVGPSGAWGWVGGLRVAAVGEVRSPAVPPPSRVGEARVLGGDLESQVLGVDAHPRQRAAHVPERGVTGAPVQPAELAVLTDAEHEGEAVGHGVTEEPASRLPHVPVAGREDDEVGLQVPTVLEPDAVGRELGQPGALRE